MLLLATGSTSIDLQYLAFLYKRSPYRGHHGQTWRPFTRLRIVHVKPQVPQASNLDLSSMARQAKRAKWSSLPTMPGSAGTIKVSVLSACRLSERYATYHHNPAPNTGKFYLESCIDAAIQAEHLHIQSHKYFVFFVHLKYVPGACYILLHILPFSSPPEISSC